MSRRTTECERVRAQLDAFVRGLVRGDLDSGVERSMPEALAVHVAGCLRCASVVSSRLVGLVAAPIADSGVAQNAEHTRAVPKDIVRRFTGILTRVGAAEFDELRDRVSRIMARRGLRFVAALEGRTLDAVDCAAAELVDVRLAIEQLSAFAGRVDAEGAQLLNEFTRWIEDSENIAESFELLRSSGWLVPRPPALPCRDDASARRRMFAWAELVLGRSPDPA